MLKYKDLILNVIAVKFEFLQQNNLGLELAVYICSRTALSRTKWEPCLFGLQTIRISRNSDKNRKEDAEKKCSL